MLRGSAILSLGRHLAACGPDDLRQVEAKRRLAWADLRAPYQRRAAPALNLHNAVRAPLTPHASVRLLQSRRQVPQMPTPDFPDDHDGLVRQVGAQNELGHALLLLLTQALGQPGLRLSCSILRCSTIACWFSKNASSWRHNATTSCCRASLPASQRACRVAGRCASGPRRLEPYKRRKKKPRAAMPGPWSLPPQAAGSRQ